VNNILFFIWEEELFVVSSWFTLPVEVNSRHQVSHLISGLALLWVLSDLMHGFDSEITVKCSTVVQNS
jgi:hypothetical protein